jgi:hypothetical protein
MTRWFHFLFLVLCLGAAVLAAGCGGGGGGAGPAPEPGTVVSKIAVLTGGEEVPPVSTNAAGSGTLGVNTTTGTASGSVSLQALPPATAVTDVHVHEGGRGVNGAIVVNLEDAGNGVWNVPAGKTLAPAQIDSFLAGTLYFNVHTEAFPEGELRGQIDQ